MFTGLIQSVGRVHCHGNGLMVKGCQPFSPLSIGDSVAVDGVCLTVSDLVQEGFLADVSEETLFRTNLGKKAEKGAAVNLEPALRLSDRLGGHLVSGHIDGLGEMISVQNLRNSWRIEVLMKNVSLSRFICEKASIAIDGISLTVAGFADQGVKFWVSVIPHTWRSTSLIHIVAGDYVNLEIDLMAKYAETLINRTDSPTVINKNLQQDISKEWLINQGWN